MDEIDYLNFLWCVIYRPEWADEYIKRIREANKQEKTCIEQQFEDESRAEMFEVKP